MTNGTSQSEIHLSCVVAGHVDHGKSTLIGCLAQQLHEAGIASGAMDVAMADPAFFTDRLQQEREGRMTVDNAAVRFDLPFGRLTLVDVPGHAEFLRNMMTGATRATVGALVVAADEGLQPQTEAHARLMGLCGVQRLILVISKMDLVDWSQDAFASVYSRLEAFLAEIGIAVANAVPVSASTGANVLLRDGVPPWCSGTFLGALRKEMGRPAEPAREPHARFVVQSVLRLPDLPALCVGRVLGGPIAEGGSLWQVGTGERLEVARIQRFPGCSRAADPGESVALEFTGATVPERGSILEAVIGSTPMATEFQAKIAWLDGHPPSNQLTAQWLYRTTPVCISPRPPSSAFCWRAKKGLLQIENIVLCVPKQEPLVSSLDCQDLGRFVLLESGGLAGAGVVTDSLGTRHETIM